MTQRRLGMVVGAFLALVAVFVGGVVDRAPVAQAQTSTTEPTEPPTTQRPTTTAPPTTRRDTPGQGTSAPPSRPDIISENPPPPETTSRRRTTTTSRRRTTTTASTSTTFVAGVIAETTIEVTTTETTTPRTVPETTLPAERSDDDASPALWLVAALAAIAAVLGVVAYLRNRRRREPVRPVRYREDTFVSPSLFEAQADPDPTITPELIEAVAAAPAGKKKHKKQRGGPKPAVPQAEAPMLWPPVADEIPPSLGTVAWDEPLPPPVREPEPHFEVEPEPEREPEPAPKADVYADPYEDIDLVAAARIDAEIPDVEIDMRGPDV